MSMTVTGTTCSVTDNVTKIALTGHLVHLFIVGQDDMCSLFLTDVCQIIGLLHCFILRV